jgi:hypothetical protein
VECGVPHPPTTFGKEIKRYVSGCPYRAIDLLCICYNRQPYEQCNDLECFLTGEELACFDWEDGTPRELFNHLSCLSAKHHAIMFGTVNNHLK